MSRPIGKPPVISSPEQFQELTNEYFDLCDKNGENYTITGLAIHLGFESRQSFYDYGKKSEYSYIIKSALVRVENAYEQRMHGNNPTGSIFVLKNMGWSDKSEVEQTSKIELTTKLPPDKLDKLKNILTE
jgi:hypothetical protein